MDPDPAPSFDGLWNHNIAYCGDLLDATPPRCDSALDIGCGDGLLARAIAQRADHVVGIDPDHASIQAAREYSTAGGNVSYVEGDFLTAPFEAESLYFITAVASLHHMPLADALTKAKTLLRPGGVLAVVGLARSSTPADFAHDAAGALTSQIVRTRRGWWRHPSPEIDPEMTYTELRRIAADELPGSVFRRRIYFRYTLTWTRPT